MKKIYFAPETKTIQVELHRMIAASDPASQLESGSLNLGGAEEGGGSGVELGSRRGSFWDDEE